MENEEILDLMRNLKDKVELEIYESKLNKNTKIIDIKYCGKVFLEETIEGEKKQTKKNIYLVIKDNDGSFSYEYYSDDMILAIDIGIIELIPSARYLNNYCTISDLEIQINNREKEKDISLEDMEKERLEEITKVSGMQKEKVRAYSEINPNAKLKNKQNVNIKNEIDPNKKITDTETFANIIPEAGKYKKIAVVCSNEIPKSYGKFNFVGITKDRNIETIEGLEPTEGTNPTEKISSVNKDGSEVKQTQVSALVKIHGRENEGFSLKIGQYGNIEAAYVRRTNDDKYIESYIETSTQKPTKKEVKEFMDKTKNTDMKEEIEKVEEQKEYGNTPTRIENINDNPLDDIIILSNGTTTTLEQEAAKAKVSTEEFLEKYNEQYKNLSTEERIENVHNEIEEEYIGHSIERKK